MAVVTVRPTHADIAIANSIAAHAEPGPEHVTKAVTWGADEHVVLLLAAAAWLYAHYQKPSLRPAARHILLVALTTSLLSHVLKSGIDQIRPDRRTVSGHWRGIPLSGRSRDAFPSGHAVHMGAIASAATALSPKPRAAVWSIAVGLCFTRILLLAHWASDVVAGFALGALIERALRVVTGYPDALPTLRRNAGSGAHGRLGSPTQAGRADG